MSDEPMTLFVPLVLTEAQATSAMVACFTIAQSGDLMARSDGERAHITTARATAAALAMALEKARQKAGAA